MKTPQLPPTDTVDTNWQIQLQKILDQLGAGRLVGSVSTVYTFKDNDQYETLLVDASAASVIITLPQPNGNRHRRVVKTDSSVNTVTISSTYLINGVASHVLSQQFASIEVIPTGTSWFISGFGVQSTVDLFVSKLTSASTLTVANGNLIVALGNLIVTVGDIALGGALHLGNAYTAGVGAATGYLTVKDSVGTTYKIPVLV